MKRLVLLVLFSGHVLAQTAPTPPPTPRHEANFDAERKQANDLFVAGQRLEALPLYEDLCRQDPTIAVFAERHAAGLIDQSAAVPMPEKAALQERARAELMRAQSLGDNSLYVQQMLAVNSKSFLGAVILGVPLTIGYTHQGTPEAHAALESAETAFGRRDYRTAIAFYERAHALDPVWYAPPLYEGDAYFSMHDLTNAAVWYQKAIEIDPDRDTAYRYWADILMKTGSAEAAKPKVEQAIVAEPYGKLAWLSLQQWAMTLKINLVPAPQVQRPQFKTRNGVLVVDPELARETPDGRGAWLAYERCRVQHGGLSLVQIIVAGSSDLSAQLTPTGYRHTLVEEAECLRAALAEVRAKIAAGSLTQATLDPSLRTLDRLDRDGMLECWILLVASDNGTRFDYPEYRKAHRGQLIAYVDRYLARPAAE